MSPAPRLGMRLHRFLFESEQQFPQATGELSALLSQLGLAGKRISRLLSAAGLIDVLGVSGKVNVQGEQQQKLDALANEIFLDAFAWGQLVPTVVTEEMELPAHLPENVQAGKYIVFLDPLDGSSNLDVNGAVGSIFSVRLLTRTGPIASEDDLMKSISTEQVVAGYFSYGPSTTLVYTAAGNPGVHVFTLDPGIGEFLLSAPDVRIPDHGPYYGANEGGIQEWGPGPRRFVEWAQERDAGHGPPVLDALLGRLRHRLPPDPAQGRDLPLPGDAEEPGREDPAHVRGGAARGGRRGCGGRGERRSAPDPGRRPRLEPPADPDLHRLHGRRRSRRIVRGRCRKSCPGNALTHSQ